MAKRLLTGNEAFAHAALEAGVGFAAGYPCIPSAEIVATVARQHAKGRADGLQVEWSANAKVALGECVAASASGIRSLFSCNSAGLDNAFEALKPLATLGVRGGLVIIVADDLEPSSLNVAQDSRVLGASARIPVLDPATLEQGFAMVSVAFDLSEAYGMPVMVRLTTRICCTSAFFDVDEHTAAYAPRPLKDGFAGFASDGARGFARDPQRWVASPKRCRESQNLRDAQLEKVAHTYLYEEPYVRFNPVYEDGRETNLLAAEAPQTSTTLGIVVNGLETAYALEALGIIAREARYADVEIPPCRLIQIGTPYPFPRRVASRFLKGLSDVLVLEEGEPFIEGELLKVAGTSFLAPTIHGKLTRETLSHGEGSTEDAAIRIARFFDTYWTSAASAQGDEPAHEDEPAPEGDLEGNNDHATMHHESNIAKRLASLPSSRRASFSDIVARAIGKDAVYEYPKPLPKRELVMCAGCPHRGSFHALKAALEQLGIARTDAVFCGDVGCSSLGYSEPFDLIDACLAAGGGISLAQGFSAVNEGKKCIAFVGDSSFFADGMPAIANAVYNNRDVTIIVLDNFTAAMSGLQPDPGTGVNLMGQHSKPIDFESVLLALGVDDVFRADPLDAAEAEHVCKRALRVEGPSAVVFDSPCVWLVRNDEFATVNVHKCTGCKKCILELGCPALGFNLDARGAKSARRGQTVIDPEQCNGCRLCVQVCPYQAIKVFGRDDVPTFAGDVRLDPEDEVAKAMFASDNAGSFNLAAVADADAGAADAMQGASEDTVEAIGSSSVALPLEETAENKAASESDRPGDPAEKQASFASSASANRPAKKPDKPNSKGADKKPSASADKRADAADADALASLFGGGVRINLDDGGAQ